MAPTWSPDGRRIAFWGLKRDSFQRDLWSVAADGSESAEGAAQPFLEDPPVDWAPVYSHDGRWLYFASTRGGTFNLWRLPLDPKSGRPQGEPQPVTAPSSWAGPMSLSADGRRLLFADRNVETEIVRAPLDAAREKLAANPEVVYSGSFELREQALSPDGAWLLFTNEDPPQQLHLVRPEGTGYRQLTNDQERNRQGAWSPDGEWIVLQTTRGDSSLAAVRADGGGWTSLAAGPGFATPSWSPDGTTIAAFDNNRGGFLFDVRGGLSAPVVRELPPIAEGLLFWPLAWSPDGALLAGRAHRGGQSEGAAVYALASGRFDRLAQWSDRGTELSDFAFAFVAPRRLASLAGRELLLSDLPDGERRALYSAPAGHRLYSLSASSDGRWLTWIDSTDESDIWLMTLDEGGEAGSAGAGARP
jgi:Tol biopolymer transport system component